MSKNGEEQIIDSQTEPRDVWSAMRAEAAAAARDEPILASYFHNTVLRHKSPEHAIADQLPQFPLEARSEHPCLALQLLRRVLRVVPEPVP